MGILPHHAPLLTTLKLGLIEVRYGAEEEFFLISGGVMEVRPDIVTILADVGENVEEIDIARAEAARQRAEKFLAEGPPPDTDEYLRMEAALRRSNLRLEAARRFGRASTRRASSAGAPEEA
jgi:F-type H+-transporting ATPase subunit epsilon